MSHPPLEEFTTLLKALLDLAPAKATALILRDDYAEQIEVEDPDEIAMHRDRALELLAWRGARAAVHLFVRAGLSDPFSPPGAKTWRFCTAAKGCLAGTTRILRRGEMTHWLFRWRYRQTTTSSPYRA